MKNVLICFVLIIAEHLAAYFAIPVLADLHRDPFMYDSAVVGSYAEEETAVYTIRNRNRDYAEVQKVSSALEREYRLLESTVAVEEDQELRAHMPNYGGAQRVVFEVVDKLNWTLLPEWV